MTERIIVTGGAGFIGARLVTELSRTGYAVTVVDDYSGDSTTAPEELAAEEVLRLRVQDLEALLEVVSGATAVVHLASSVLIRGGEQDPDRDVAEALLGARCALEACRIARVSRFCLASSASVYGWHGARAIEEDDPLRPLSLYGACKAGAEALSHAYASLYGIDVTVFRFGNVQGPGVRRGVIVDFVEALRRDPSKLRVLGDGRQRKSYLAVEDCVSGIIQLALDRDTRGHEIFNLSADGTVPVLDIAYMVSAALGVRPDITCVGGASGWPGDVPELHLSAVRAKAHGWTPRCDAVTAVRRTVDSLVGRLQWQS